MVRSPQPATGRARRSDTSVTALLPAEGTASFPRGDSTTLLQLPNAPANIVHMQSRCQEPPSPERDLPSRPTPEVILSQGRPDVGQRQDPPRGTQSLWEKSPRGAEHGRRR